MPKKIYVDEWCEVFDLLQPVIDGSFWNFEEVDIEPDSVYVLGRLEFDRCRDRIVDVVENQRAYVIFSNPSEGSTSMISGLDRWRESSKHLLMDLAATNRLALLSGGDMGPAYKSLLFEFFAYRLSKFDENIAAMRYRDQIFNTGNKPYTFLFLNGRSRYHRRYMLNRWQHTLLPGALWSNLDDGNGPRQLLPREYEVDRYQHNIDCFPDASGFVKFELFSNETFDNNYFGHDGTTPRKSRMAVGKEWGEAYIWPPQYVDTYFSVVSETVFKTDCSFRTEKIWKPIMIGHPWIAVANRGFLRDMHNLGFRSFGHLIDESFDLMDHDQRLDRIMTVVEDLVRQDLDSWLVECREVCEHNQQRFLELANTSGDRLPEQFLQFVREVTNE